MIRPCRQQSAMSCLCRAALLPVHRMRDPTPACKQAGRELPPTFWFSVVQLYIFCTELCAGE